MIGQEARYALSVKYGKEGKPVPQYDWAEPTDYGEEGVPTPVVDAGGNAGLLREGYPKMGLEAARANVQAALYREDGETPQP